MVKLNLPLAEAYLDADLHEFPKSLSPNHDEEDPRWEDDDWDDDDDDDD